MMRRVSMFLLFFLVTSLLFGLGGCIDAGGDTTQVLGDQERGVPLNLRPEKYWGEIWKVKDKVCTLETEADQAVFEAQCSLEYLGEKSVDNVQVVIGSPLTGKLIGDQPAESYGKVKPGESFEYSLYVERSAWRDLLTAGTSEKNVVEDFTLNAYVDIFWLDSGQEYTVRLFEWN